MSSKEWGWVWEGVLRILGFYFKRNGKLLKEILNGMIDLVFVVS